VELGFYHNKNTMEHLEFKSVLKVSDYSVSKETFELLHDPILDLLITTPQPAAEQLPKYYESENYISHTDGKRSVFEKMYHFVKSIALKNKLQLIDRFHPEKGNLLDIGAGTGEFLVVAKNKGWQTIGVEPSEKARGIAQQKGISFAPSTHDLPSHSFDCITMWHVLEHVPNLEDQLSELKRLLKSDGTLVVAVPNFKSFDAGYYGNFWAAYDVPRHLWHFSKTAIQGLFQKQDLNLIQVLPMKFDSFYVSLLSEKYKTGKMNYFNAFRIGWLSNLKAKRSKEYSSHIYVLKNK
jgi:2-polyprenyl-3-methyl-5-hydroxy-6-metoxy-1,4-benzoquinol methylase